VDYEKIAGKIVDAVGGKENIVQATHCMTRLRLTLNNKELFNKATIEGIQEVKGSILSGNQHQIILGTGIVEKVHAEVINLLGLKKDQSDSNEVKHGKINPLKMFIKVLSDIFIPIIPVLVASGFLMGIVGLFIYPGYFYADKSLVQVYPQFSGIATMVNMFANTVFMFLPVVIGFSATKRFGGNAYVGAVLGLIMVNPQLINPTVVGVNVPTWNMFGYEIKQLGYQSTVLPILVASFLLAKIDNWFKAKLPQLFKILSAGIAILIVGIITFLLIGPVLRSVGFYVSDGLVWLYSNMGIFGGIIFGLLYSPCVITGMHHAFIPIEVQLVSNISTTGGTFILPMAAMNNVALGGSALAIWYLTKDKVLKTEAGIAGLTSIMGISEPALFGINLKFKHAFISALIGSSAGSAIMSFFQIRARGMGAGGVMGYLLYDPRNLLIYTIGMIVSVVIAFTLTVTYEKMRLRKNDNVE